MATGPEPDYANWKSTKEIDNAQGFRQILDFLFFAPLMLVMLISLWITDLFKAISRPWRKNAK